MSIKALPKATSHLLCSSQVLETQVSLIKELIDNALDAKATSVDLCISSNTIDRIEVRDNGHGIAVQDLDSLGKRGYTSKLRSFEEMRMIGGLSLGFRGEALASAADLGDISVTTRTEGEATATNIKLKSDGGFNFKSPASHPIGTTVCIVNLFSKLPVRKQMCLKQIKKTLTSVKDLLQSYALARLNIRFSLKVLKSTISSWSFAPGAKDGVREVVSLVIGRDIAAQCMEKTGTLSSKSQLGPEAPKSSSYTKVDSECDEQLQQPTQFGFVMQAFLPRLDADLCKIDRGQYVSIDSRPVCCTRGTPKKIITAYKAAIRAIASGSILEKLKDPFLRLNIVCPPGSYDPNVEPAKDDVLFEDENLLLCMADSWFRSIYACQPTFSDAKEQHLAEQVGRVDALLAQNGPNCDVGCGDFLPSVELDSEKRCFTSAENGQEKKATKVLPGPHCEDGIFDERISSAVPVNTDFTKTMGETKSMFDMSKDYSEETDEDELNENGRYSPIATEIEPRDRMNTLNPWAIAKLNTPLAKKWDQEYTITSFRSGTKNRRQLDKHLNIPMPRASLSPSSEQHCIPARKELSLDGTTKRGDPQTSLETWLRQNHTSSESSQSIMSPLTTISKRSNIPLENDGTMQARETLPSISCSPPATKGYVAPPWPGGKKNQHQSPMTNLAQMGIESSSLRDLGATVLPLQTAQCEEVTPNTLGIDVQIERDRILRGNEVEHALEFERRKDAATRKLREKLRQSRSKVEGSAILNEGTRSSPNRNFYSSAIRGLNASWEISPNSIDADKMPSKTHLPDDDPRAYLMRRNKSVAAQSEKPGVVSKLKRMKTNLLPLEAIPKNAEIHNVVHIVAVNIAVIGMAMCQLAAHDGYAKSGNQSTGFDIPAADLIMANKKLDIVVKKWRRIEGHEGECLHQI